jgi:hypothetical protein
MDIETVTNEALQARLSEVNDEYLKKILLQQQTEKLDEFAKKEADIMKSFKDVTKNRERIEKEGRTAGDYMTSYLNSLYDPYSLVRDPVKAEEDKLKALRKQREAYMKEQKELLEFAQKQIDSNPEKIKRDKQDADRRRSEADQMMGKYNKSDGKEWGTGQYKGTGALDDIGNEGGKDIEKRRDRANNAKEKIIYFKQLIRIVLTDTLGNIVPRCDFLITRSKCTRQIIEGIFNQLNMFANRYRYEILYDIYFKWLTYK